VIKPANFGTILLDNKNYQELLNASINEFFSEKESSRLNRLLDKYKAASKHRKIHYCFLKIDSILISSCILVETQISFEGHSVLAYFITQVVTTKNYRGRGFVKQLIKEVENFSDKNNVSLLIVVARRAVGDLYWKLGFSGFSYFPEFTLKQPNISPPSNLFRPTYEFDLNQMERLFLKNSSNKFGQANRSRNDWTDILDLQSHDGYQFLTLIHHEKAGYIIAKDDVVLELVLNPESNYKLSLINELEKSYRRIIIDQFEPAAKFISNDKWVYNERFEAREGHLIKCLDNASTTTKDFAQEVTIKGGLFRLRLSLVDQW